MTEKGKRDDERNQKKGIGDRYRSCFIFAGILNKHAGKDEIKGGDAFVFTAYIVSAISIYKEQAEKFLKKQFLDENLLMIIATVGAFFVGRYKEAVAAMLFYQVGKLVEKSL